MIYLDYNATTPIDKRVARAMEPYIYEKFGNPSSTHKAGEEAKKGINKARNQVAEILGAKSSEIIFTGTGSESNNTVLKGVIEKYSEKGNHIITSQIEHPSIINVCKYLEQKGVEITYLPVNKDGKVKPEDVKQAIKEETILISIMHANNEVGTIQPIKEISQIARKNEVLVHTDAAQTVGKIPVNVHELGVDFLSVAGHKLYAPKGIGALYIKDNLDLEPLIHGASQEAGIRAGTENVIFAIALGKACALAEEDPIENKLRKLSDYFLNLLEKSFGDEIVLNGHLWDRLPNTLNISFKGYKGNEILEKLEGVAASTGSACHSEREEPSEVLQAMGVKRQIALGAIRFSLGRYSEKKELEKVIDKLNQVLES